MPASKESQDIGTVALQIAQITAEVLVLILQILLSVIVSLVNLFLPKQPKSVRNEIVLITGGGHGMGKELSLLYASEGATVVVWDVNEDTGNQTVKEIAQQGYPRAYFFKCDVSNRENVLDVAKETQVKVGNVTILINNAGIMPTHPLIEHTTQEIERIININVMAHFWTLEAFLPIMKKHNNGHVVSLSSNAGILGLPNLVPYCTSKFAVRGMMEALFEEFRTDKRNQVQFTTVCPFIVDTGLCKKPKIRFEAILPIVNPKDAAKQIMEAQRLGLSEITIPAHLNVLFKILKLLPHRAQLNILDFLDVGVNSDLS